MKLFRLIIIVTCLVFFGCNGKSVPEQSDEVQRMYDEIEVGMTRFEVAEILAGPTASGKKVKSEKGSMKKSSKDGLINFVVKFTGDKVSSKSWIASPQRQRPPNEN